MNIGSGYHIVRDLLRDSLPLLLVRFSGQQIECPACSVEAARLTCPPVTCGACTCPATGSCESSYTALLCCLLVGIVIGLVVPRANRLFVSENTDRPKDWSAVSEEPRKRTRAELQEGLRLNNGVSSS